MTTSYTKHITYMVDENGQATAEVECFHFAHPDKPNACIPEAPGNTDYDTMMAEVAVGEAEIIEVDDTVLPDYAAMRRRAYAPTGDQLDMQYHDGKDGTTTWVDHVRSVKAAHPKPE
tara:strand:+ start:1167 stop:1517 length:351 start_codon:yes stop_codon:yes gene_type:complete